MPEKLPQTFAPDKKRKAMQSLYVKMHSCQASSTQKEDQGVTRKTLRIRNVELEGNVWIQNMHKALEMEAAVTHLLEDNQADTR